MSRKRTLVDHGFRLPSAMDNRPLKWEEFLERIGQTVYLSATPGPYELSPRQGRRRRAGHPADRSGRPGDRRQADQGPDRRPGARDQAARRAGRARAGHDADEEDVRGPHRLPARARHPGALPALRGRHDPPHRAAARSCGMGEFDVLVGINLLREGLDLPEVSLVAILDADKEGFLRSRHVADPDDRPRGPQRQRPGAHVRRHDHARRWRRRSTRPTAAAPSRSPTTPSAGSTRSRCARRSPTSSTTSSREDPELVGGSGRSQSRGKAPVPGMASKSAAGQARRRSWPGMPRAELAHAHPAAAGPDARGRRASCTSSSPPGCATRSTS